MFLKVLKEYGYNEALFGIGLNKKITSEYRNWNSIPEVTQLKLYEIALKLCKLDYGHNKFLETIQVWVDINAPLYWWKQFDTYRIGITKQSESTMHTLMSRKIELSDFEPEFVRSNHINDVVVDYLNDLRETGNDFYILQGVLPQCYLQRRLVVMNYKTLKNIIKQRKDHKLPEWNYFCKEMLGLIKNPEFIS